VAVEDERRAVVVSVSGKSGSTTETSKLERHYSNLLRGLRWGKVTPVLGAGASLFGRSNPMAWHGAPTAAELADRLANEFEADVSTSDLLTVAQWIYALRGGSGQLYEALHEIFDKDFPTTPLHEFLAATPKRLRERNLGRPLLIVTTNYDDLMERALVGQGEEFDLVVYMADGPNKGCFFHRPPHGMLKKISDPENYTAVSPDRRTVVLKLHGFVCREDQSCDSYVITEDHYIEYLTHTDLTLLLPPNVVSRLLDCHLLFLGYSLRDWNLRAILYRLWLGRLRDNNWWGVQRNPSEVEQSSWRNRSVELFDIALESYLAGLENVFENWIKDKPLSAAPAEMA
jgi:hypothetical protein